MRINLHSAVRFQQLAVARLENQEKSGIDKTIAICGDGAFLSGVMRVSRSTGIRPAKTREAGSGMRWRGCVNRPAFN